MRRLLFCQHLGGQLPTLPIHHLRPCPMKDLAFIVQYICVTKSLFSPTQVKIIQKQSNSAFKKRLIKCIQILSVFRPNPLHSIFEFLISEFISNLEKHRVQHQLGFFSGFNLLSTACVACKNQFRNQMDFSVF